MTGPECEPAKLTWPLGHHVSRTELGFLLVPVTGRRVVVRHGSTESSATSAPRGWRHRMAHGSEAAPPTAHRRSRRLQAPRTTGSPCRIPTGGWA